MDPLPPQHAVHISHYKVLGLSPSAGEVEIRAAYKAAVVKAHPDKGGTPQSFAAVRTAYETLINRDHRKEYDELQLAQRRAKTFRRPPPLFNVKMPAVFPLPDGEPYTFETSPDRLRCKFRHGDIVSSSGRSGCFIGLGAFETLYWVRQGDTFATALFSVGMGEDRSVQVVLRAPSMRSMSSSIRRTSSAFNFSSSASNTSGANGGGATVSSSSSPPPPAPGSPWRSTASSSSNAASGAAHGSHASSFAFVPDEVRVEQLREEIINEERRRRNAVRLKTLEEEEASRRRTLTERIAQSFLENFHIFRDELVQLGWRSRPTTSFSGRASLEPEVGLGPARSRTKSPVASYIYATTTTTTMRTASPLRATPLNARPSTAPTASSPGPVSHSSTNSSAAARARSPAVAVDKNPFLSRRPSAPASSSTTTGATAQPPPLQRPLSDDTVPSAGTSHSAVNGTRTSRVGGTSSAASPHRANDVFHRPVTAGVQGVSSSFSGRAKTPTPLGSGTGVASRRPSGTASPSPIVRRASVTPAVKAAATPVGDTPVKAERLFRTASVGAQRAADGLLKSTPTGPAPAASVSTTAIRRPSATAVSSTNVTGADASQQAIRVKFARYGSAVGGTVAPPQRSPSPNAAMAGSATVAWSVKRAVDSLLESTTAERRGGSVLGTTAAVSGKGPTTPMKMDCAPILRFSKARESPAAASSSHVAATQSQSDGAA